MADIILDDDTIAYLNQIAEEAMQKQAAPEQSTPKPKKYVPYGGYKRRTGTAPVDWAQRKADAMTKSGYGPTSPIWGKQVEVLLDAIDAEIDRVLFLADELDPSATIDGHPANTAFRDPAFSIHSILREWRKRLIYAKEMKDE